MKNKSTVTRVNPINKYVSEDVEQKEKETLTPEQLDKITDDIFFFLKNKKGVIIKGTTYLGEKLKFNGKDIDKHETYSGMVGLGFINVSANGTVYHKKNKSIQSNTIANITSNGEVNWIDETANKIIDDILIYQKENFIEKIS